MPGDGRASSNAPSFRIYILTSIPVIYPLSLHDALPISCRPDNPGIVAGAHRRGVCGAVASRACVPPSTDSARVRSRCSRRSEEHTSELQSRLHLVCRLLLEIKDTFIQISLLPGLTSDEI